MILVHAQDVYDDHGDTSVAGALIDLRNRLSLLEEDLLNLRAALREASAFTQVIG